MNFYIPPLQRFIFGGFYTRSSRTLSRVTPPRKYDFVEVRTGEPGVSCLIHSDSS